MRHFIGFRMKNDYVLLLQLLWTTISSMKMCPSLYFFTPFLLLAILQLRVRNRSKLDWFYYILLCLTIKIDRFQKHYRSKVSNFWEKPERTFRTVWLSWNSKLISLWPKYCCFEACKTNLNFEPNTLISIRQLTNEWNDQFKYCFHWYTRDKYIVIFKSQTSSFTEETTCLILGYKYIFSGPDIKNGNFNLKLLKNFSARISMHLIFTKLNIFPTFSNHFHFMDVWNH